VVGLVLFLDDLENVVGVLGMGAVTVKSDLLNYGACFELSAFPVERNLQFQG